MHLRKTIALGAAAVLAAGLLGLTSTATASSPTGGAVNYIAVNGTSATGVVPINGVFASGTASFGGGTFGCVGGSFAGDVDRGAVSGTDVSFSTLSIVCATPLGINATISISPSCTTGQVAATFTDTPNGQGFSPNVHYGTVDTGPITGTKFSNVDGVVAVPTNCVTVSAPGGCTAKVTGNVKAYFNEAVKTVGGVDYQDLILSGTGFTLSGQTTYCFGLLTGGITLNDIAFNVEVTGGSTTGIDFRPIAANPTGGAVASVGVNGSTTAGTVAIDGMFKSGTTSFGGGTFACVGGSVAGNVDRGAATGTDIVLSTASIICTSLYYGLNATISISPGCVISAGFTDTPNAQGTTPNVHDGTVDTGPTNDPNFSNVDGVVSAPTNCVTITIPGGCTAKVTGNVKAYFNEAIKSVGGVNYQDLILDGTGFTISNQTALCFGFLTGGVALNAIDFNIKVTSGTTTGIDFRLT